MCDLSKGNNITTPLPGVGWRLSSSTTKYLAVVLYFAGIDYFSSAENKSMVKCVSSIRQGYGYSLPSRDAIVAAMVLR